MKKLILVTAAISFCILSAAAFAKTMACRGEVKTGTTDDAVGDCSVLTPTPADTKIFKVCKMGDECEVIGKGDGDWLKQVISVRLIKKAP